MNNLLWLPHKTFIYSPSFIILLNQLINKETAIHPRYYLEIKGHPHVISRLYHGAASFIHLLNGVICNESDIKQC